MAKQYLTPEECEALGLPEGCYIGDSADELPMLDVAHATTEFDSYAEEA